MVRPDAGFRPTCRIAQAMWMSQLTMTSPAMLASMAILVAQLEISSRSVGSGFPRFVTRLPRTGRRLDLLARRHSRIEPRVRQRRLRRGFSDLFARCSFGRGGYDNSLNGIGLPDLGVVVDRRQQPVSHGAFREPLFSKSVQRSILQALGGGCRSCRALASRLRDQARGRGGTLRSRVSLRCWRALLFVGASA